MSGWGSQKLSILEELRAVSMTRVNGKDAAFIVPWGYESIQQPVVGYL